MKNTFLGLAAVLLFVAAAPPVHELAEGQVKRSDGIHMGSRSTPIHVEGNLYVSSTDGGFSVSGTGGVTATTVTATTVTVASTKAVVSSQQDGGTGQMRFLSGYGVLAGNDLAVTFNPAFAAIPDCVCSSVNATAAACGVKAIPSASAVTFRGANATDPIYWSCHGAK